MIISHLNNSTPPTPKRQFTGILDIKLSLFEIKLSSQQSRETIILPMNIEQKKNIIFFFNKQ